MLVCHSCDNPSCCSPSHLFLGTHKDNAQDASQKDRTLFGEKSKAARLNEADVLDVYRQFDAGLAPREIAAQYGVTYQCIQLIVAGKNWARLYKQHRLREHV